jgi:transposase
MRAYSLDLRRKIVEAVQRGTTKSEVARFFGVSRSSVKRYVKMAVEVGSLAPSKPPGSHPKIDKSSRRLLEMDLKERPAATLAQRCAYLLETIGLRVSVSTVWRWLKSMQWSCKKRSVKASERDEWQKAAWRVLVSQRIDARRLVCRDEMGTNTSLCSLYAWSPRGKRALCSVPRNRSKNITLLASMTCCGIGPCLAVVGSTTKEVFEAYVENVLAPTLQPDRVVVMDNLVTHKGRCRQGDDRG